MSTSIRLSPDGQRAAVESQETPNSDLWIHDLTRKSRTRLTFDPGNEGSPIWDGRFGLYEKPANGGGEERLIFESDQDVWPLDASADGRYVIVNKGSYSTRSNTDLWILSLTGGGQPIPFATSTFDENDAAFSPDGRFIAYSSDESGREEIYVSPFQDPARGGTPGGQAGTSAGGPKWQISTAGGQLPRWSRDVKEIYYRRADNATIASVQVNGGGKRFVIGAEQTLFLAFQRFGLSSYDVSADGTPRWSSFVRRRGSGRNP